MAGASTRRNSSPGARYWLSETVEILPATLCSFATSEHVFHTERMATNEQRILCPPFIHFDSHLSPGLVLTSCIFFGVSVSSFVYRRQTKDQTQAFIFLTIMTMAIVLGYGAGASANIVLLGWLPWAVDAAMLISIWNFHLSGGLLERPRVDEKFRLFE